MQRRGEHADHRHDEQDQRQQQPGDVIHQHAGLGVPAPGLVFGQNRHEGLRKRALGEQPAQQVGDAEGDEEGVGVEPRAEDAGDDGVAHEAENARQQRHAAHGGEGLEQIHGALS